MRVKSLAILKKYVPDGYYIINTYESAPTKVKKGGSSVKLSHQGDFMKYIRGNKVKDILKNLETAVHESCHGYNSHMGTVLSDKCCFNTEAFYMGNEKTKLVEHTKTFKSRKLVKSIPKELRTFRFGTYINSKMPFLGTQQNGIYGLLDEMTAYYWGTNTSVSLFDYYDKEVNTGSEKWLDYISSSASTMVAHKEFKFYILKYLIYAKKNEPEIYKGIMSNKDFIYVFLTIDKMFVALESTYEKNLIRISEKVKANGGSARISDGTFWIGNQGVGLMNKDKETLNKELKKEVYSQVMESLKKSI